MDGLCAEDLSNLKAALTEAVRPTQNGHVRLEATVRCAFGHK
jgi:hypothetical protein